MKNLFSTKRLIAFVTGLMITAVAVAAVYVGFNPTTGLNSVPGVPVAVGNMPVLDASTSCGTLATVQASQVGGAGTFQVTANQATTCSLVVDMPSAAPNGYYCIAFDETTRAATFSQTAHSTTACTVSATAGIVSGDKVLVEVNGF